MLVETIQKQHRQLRELFMQHQESLLQANFTESVTLLTRFNKSLAAHMTVEEEYLFPEFARIESKTRWNVDLYIMEHEKIRKLYENIEEDLVWLAAQKFNDSDQRRNIIALLDKEKTFKGLLEHHEDREEDAMLKELDEVLPGDRIGELVRVVDASFQPG